MDSLKVRAQGNLCQCSVRAETMMIKFALRASLLLLLGLSLGQSKLTGGQFSFIGEDDPNIPPDGVMAHQMLVTSMDMLRTLRNENQNVFYLRKNDGKIVKIVRARRGI